MHDSRRQVVFTLDDGRYALPLPAVDRIIRAVEVTPLPKAPQIVLGVVNVHGRVIPVVNIRQRFRLPEREIDPSDQFIIARTAKRIVALVVDAVAGVREHLERDMVKAEDVLPAMEYVEGVIKLDGGLILVHDLDKFLSLEEEEALDDAVR